MSPVLPSDFVVYENVFCQILVSPEVYELDAILKTAYLFTGRCFIHLEPTLENLYRVRLKAKNTDQDMGALAGEFCNELLDQTLRLKIGRDTEHVRNLILAQAFSKTSLIEPDYEKASYREDPLQVQVRDGK
jgi:His-Xaa-Ser system protein HxsD